MWSNLIIGTQLDVAKKSKVAALGKKYYDIFPSSDKRLGECRIGFYQIPTENASPVSKPLQKFSPRQVKEIHRQLQEMVEIGVETPCKCDWSSNLVLVRKKTGEIRMCVDSRPLNIVTRKDLYRMPNIQTLLDSLHGSRYFTTLELASGYWQMRIAEEDKNKIALLVPGPGGGRFR